MKILGIDASSTSTGIAVFDNKELIFHTTIKPKGEDWRDRLFHEGEQINLVIRQYKPDIVYMEDVPLKRSGGMKTLVVLGGVQGFIYGIMATHGIHIEFVSPSKWRSELKLFDGTRSGQTREVLKEKAISIANKTFGLDLVWAGPSSKKSQDDEAESILIGYYGVKQNIPEAKYFSRKQI